VTGIRIEVDINAAPEQFLARVRELDAVAAAMPAPAPLSARIETLVGLFDA
jgi:hypothetical protein